MDAVSQLRYRLRMKTQSHEDGPNDAPSLALHDLVIVDGEPLLGVARLLESRGEDARLLLYRDGSLVWRKLSALRLCPAGTAVAPGDPP